MGRPLNKKYFGARNAGVTGSFNPLIDPTAKIDGQGIASVSIASAGAYTAGTNFYSYFPIPLGSEGTTGSRAKGTPYVTTNGGTLSGTATLAYSPSDILSVNGVTATFTPTIATGTITITAVSTGGTLTISPASTFIKGTSITIGTGGAGSTFPAGTYYVGASTSSSTSLTLSATYNGTVISSASSFSGSVSATYGTTYGALSSVAVTPGTAQTVNSIPTSTGAVTPSVSSGAGAVITPTYGLTGITISDAGAGYLTSTPSTTITATTTAATITTGNITVNNTSGSITLATAQTAGTFFVGQVVSFSGTASGGGSISAGSYVVTATDGTANLTLATTASNNADTVSRTAAVTVVGTITSGLTMTTAGTVTLSTTDELVPGMDLTVASGSFGGNGAGNYFVIAVYNATTVVLASSYSNYFASTPLSVTTTTGLSVAATGSQYLVVTIGGTGTAGSGAGTVTAVLTTAVTTGYSGRYESILASANVGGTVYQDVNIIKQEGSHNYRVLVQGGSYPGTLCKLTGAAPTSSGLMAINATDSAGGTYWVYKITNRKAYLIRNTGTQFASYQAVPWNLTTPVANVSVTIDNG